MHQERHIHSPGDDCHPASGFGHADHFGQHPIGIGLFDDGDRHRDVKTTVGKRKRLRIAAAEFDRALQALSPSQGSGFMQQIAIDVDAGDAVSFSCALG